MDVVVIESDKKSCSRICNFLGNKSHINVIGKAFNGIDGFKLIYELKPQVAIISLALTHLDGLTLLEKLKDRKLIANQNGITRCIVISDFNSEYVYEKINKLPVDYLMFRPFSLKSLYLRLMDLPVPTNTALELSSENEYILENILKDFGIRTTLKGFKYIKESIIMLDANDSLLDGITKILYLEVAKCDNTEKIHVERSMRHAIEVAWNKGNARARFLEMGYHKADNSKRPTNSEFLALTLDYYRIKVNKKQERLNKN